jgi:hypothetical protein
MFGNQHKSHEFEHLTKVYNENMELIHKEMKIFKTRYFNLYIFYIKLLSFLKCVCVMFFFNIKTIFFSHTKIKKKTNRIARRIE